MPSSLLRVQLGGKMKLYQFIIIAGRQIGCCLASLRCNKMQTDRATFTNLHWPIYTGTGLNDSIWIHHGDLILLL
ncbi:unnamed protein product [Urochloa humidicola]